MKNFYFLLPTNPEGENIQILERLRFNSNLSYHTTVTYWIRKAIYLFKYVSLKMFTKWEKYSCSICSRECESVEVIIIGFVDRRGATTDIAYDDTRFFHSV